jgi:Zn-dependent protease with chaperone function
VVVEAVVSVEPQPAPNDDQALARRNRRRGFAVAGFPGMVAAVIVAAVCIVLAGPIVGVGIGVAVGIAVSIGTWWSATPLLVRALHAEPADEDDQARVFNQVEGLCATMGLVLPTVYVVDDESRGALVLGRRRRVAVLVVTSGLVDALDPVQLEGVLAHELAHVKSADIVPATMAAAVALPLVAILPGMANVVHTLAGRGREFRTDQMAVSVTRYPPGLREALALMVDGPVSSPSSPLAGRGVAHVTRWLWTVSLADATGGRRSQGGSIGELDDAAVRIAALDEW